jgi:hypothetical protein
MLQHVVIRSDMGDPARAELGLIKNVVLQQMELEDMTNENRSDQRAAPERGQRPGMRSTPASAHSGPPILSDGLELPRSNHC